MAICELRSEWDYHEIIHLPSAQTMLGKLYCSRDEAALICERVNRYIKPEQIIQKEPQHRIAMLSKHGDLARAIRDVTLIMSRMMDSPRVYYMLPALLCGDGD